MKRHKVIIRFHCEVPERDLDSWKDRKEFTDDLETKLRSRLPYSFMNVEVDMVTVGPLILPEDFVPNQQYYSDRGKDTMEPP